MTPNTAGFSLIEVLVTLLVVSFLFAGIFGFISQLGTIKRITSSVSEQAELTALESFLKRRLSSARKAPIFSEGFLQQRFLRGDSTGFTFVSEVRRGSVGQGLFDVTIKWNKQKTNFSESHSYRRLSKEASNTSIEYSLFEDVDDVSISYGGYSSQSGEFSWDNEWNAIRLLPVFIRLRGVFKGSIRDEDFSFIIALN